jgi:hypothetical protein
VGIRKGKRKEDTLVQNMVDKTGVDESGEDEKKNARQMKSTVQCGYCLKEIEANIFELHQLGCKRYQDFEERSNLEEEVADDFYDAQDIATVEDDGEESVETNTPGIDQVTENENDNNEESSQVDDGIEEIDTSDTSDIDEIYEDNITELQSLPVAQIAEENVTQLQSLPVAQIAEENVILENRDEEDGLILQEEEEEEENEYLDPTPMRTERLLERNDSNQNIVSGVISLFNDLQQNLEQHTDADGNLNISRTIPQSEIRELSGITLFSAAGGALVGGISSFLSGESVRSGIFRGAVLGAATGLATNIVAENNLNASDSRRRSSENFTGLKNIVYKRAKKNLNNLVEALPQSNNDLYCTICLDNIEGAAVITLPCMHRFHKDCIKEYWQSKLKNTLENNLNESTARPECPNCRLDVLKYISES